MLLQVGQLEEGSERYSNLAAYWQQQLASPPALLQLPLDGPRPQEAGGKPATGSSFWLTPEQTTALKQLAAALGCSLYTVFLAAYRWARDGGQQPATLPVICCLLSVFVY